MDNIIQVITEIITTGFEKHIKKIAEEKQDISQFILATKKDLDNVGCMLVAEALETIDEAVKKAPERKKGWYVHGRKPNTLATIFGEVHYERTYYKNKDDGSYRSLSDTIVGIGAYDKMDLSLEAKCVENAITLPYRKSGLEASKALGLSGQTVMNAIRRLGPLPLYEAKESEERRKVKYLFIEADEDHVAMRGNRAGEPKLVYVHEGLRWVSKDRWELTNPVYFSGMFRRSDELWTAVEEYIDMTYDRENISKIYLSGDRGSWIREGAGWIKDSIYVVDKYHLLKAVRKAGAHIENGCDAIWKAIKRQDLGYLDTVLETIKDHPDSEGKKLAEVFRYIRASFETTIHYHDEGYRGCSAEGHVSHILSDRLSSRPRVWCEIGIDEMARLRVTAKNGEEIYPMMLRMKKEHQKEQESIAIDKRIVHDRKLAAGSEMQHNIPGINRGEVGGSLRIWKTLRGM